MNTINALKSVPRIKTILGNTCKDLESYLLHLGHKWCPWNRGFSNERFIVVVLFFVASCTTSKFWRTQDLMSAFLKQLRKKNLSFYLVICTFICGSYESTGKCHAGFIFLFFCYLLYAVYLFQPLATTAPSSTQSEPVAVKQEKTVSCSTSVTSLS